MHVPYPNIFYIYKNKYVYFGGVGENIQCVNGISDLSDIHSPKS